MSSFEISHAMMKPLTLTPEEERMIVEEADRIVTETFAAHELHVANKRELPRSEWKHVKSKENLHVYRSTQMNPSSRESVAASMQEPGTIEISKPIDLPLIVATGTLSGTVEDALLGALAHTESRWRRRCAIIKDEYDAMKILATIKAPTPEDPFSSIVLKWETKRVGALSRVRDCVFVEVTGLATDSDGQQVAYYVLHSIDSIPRITGLRHLDIVRLNISTCWIVRRYDDSSIELFSRGFADPGGMFAAAKGNNMIYPELLLAAGHVIDCAYVKKLIWLMYTKRQSEGEGSLVVDPSPCSSSSSSSNSNSNSNSSASKSSQSSTGSKTCGNCTTSLKKLGSLIRSRIVCRACHEEVCHKCSVEKKFPVEVTSTEMKLKQLTFCLRCLLEAKQASPRTVALTLLEILP